MRVVGYLFFLWLIILHEFICRAHDYIHTSSESWTSFTICLHTLLSSATVSTHGYHLLEIVRPHYLLSSSGLIPLSLPRNILSHILSSVVLRRPTLFLPLAILIPNKAVVAYYFPLFSTPRSPELVRILFLRFSLPSLYRVFLFCQSPHFRSIGDHLSWTLIYSKPDAPFCSSLLGLYWQYSESGRQKHSIYVYFEFNSNYYQIVKYSNDKLIPCVAGIIHSFILFLSFITT